MITFNNHSFVKVGSSVGEASGFYKVAKRSILIYDRDMQPTAVVNRELVLGRATLAEDGKIWYSYLPSSHFLYREGYLEQRQELEGLAKGMDHRGYFFK